MHLELITPDKTVFSGEIKQITIPGTKGLFTIMKNHAPIISSTEAGELSIVTGDGIDMLFKMSVGVVEENHGVIMVLAEKIDIVE